MSNADIQNVMDNANSGDTIYFQTGTYNNVSLNSNKTLTYLGQDANTILTAFAQNSSTVMFAIEPKGATTTAGTAFYNLTFVMNSANGFSGRIIELYSGANVTVSNCSFTDGSAAIYLRNIASSGYTIIDNCYFTGRADASTIGTNSENGNKVISMMGGANVNITNNIFNGSVLDGVSIAQNARNVLIQGNTFLDNYYGIFFGGGVTNITINNNTFNGSKVYSVDLQKATTNSTISNNKFISSNGSTEIHIVKGDTHHGAPTTISDVYIINNNFTTNPGVNPYTVQAVFVYSEGGPLEVTGTLNITRNTLVGGIKLFTFIDKEWETNDGIVIEPEPPVVPIISGTNITVISKVGNKFTIVLKDSKNQLIANKTVTFTINGKSYNMTTNENGVAGLDINLNTGNYTIYAAYSNNNGSINNSYTVTVKQGMTRIIGTDQTSQSGTKGNYRIQLVDANGQGIQGTVAFHIHGKAYYQDSDANGYASLDINLAKGTYNMYVSYDGTYLYQGTTAGNQIIRT
jgi:parallel beta-helix repeat protein